MSDAIVLLTTDPRPPFARSLAHLSGEAFEIWVGGERRLHYRVYKDDADEDFSVVVFRVL
jgi:pyridoxine/pyridoxamine 5'-phosphate oxidase